MSSSPKKKPALKKKPTATATATATSASATAASVKKKAVPKEEEYVVPLVKVLPFDQKSTPADIHPEDIKKKFPKGLLAWGDCNTAVEYGQKFDLVVITAEEFNISSRKFVDNVLRKKNVSVILVPISEVANGKLTEKNMISQNALSVRYVQGNVITKLTKYSSQQLIQNALAAHQKILVVCMAGRNRSTSTLINFLMLNSLSTNFQDIAILKKARKRLWTYEQWKSYLSLKRDFEIYPINDLQLCLLERHMQILRHAS